MGVQHIGMYEGYSFLPIMQYLQYIVAHYFMTFTCSSFVNLISDESDWEKDADIQTLNARVPGYVISMFIPDLCCICTKFTSFILSVIQVTIKCIHACISFFNILLNS